LVLIKDSVIAEGGQKIMTRTV